MPDTQQKITEQNPLGPIKSEGTVSVVPADIVEKKAQNDLSSCPDPAVKSKGEKVFDKTVYTGINYFVNLISSVAIADKFLHGSWKGALDRWISGSTKFFSKFAPIKTAHHYSKNALETLSLLTGGMVLLIPMKVMEDNKRPIVHWLNKKLGVNQKAADGHEETPDEIYIEKEQPKQSWGNVIWRRIMATVAIIGSGAVLDRAMQDKKNAKPESYDLGWAKVEYEAKPKGGKDVVTEKGFEKINGITKVLRGKGFAEKGIGERWTKLLILDSMFTIINAVIMKITNGAKKAKMPGEHDNSHDPDLVRDGIDEIVTAEDMKKQHRSFVQRVETRVNKLIDYKNSPSTSLEPRAGFVESIRTPDAVTGGVGV